MAGKAPAHSASLITVGTLITQAAFAYNPISLASLHAHLPPPPHTHSQGDTHTWLPFIKTWRAKESCCWLAGVSDPFLLNQNSTGTVTVGPEGFGLSHSVKKKKKHLAFQFIRERQVKKLKWGTTSHQSEWPSFKSLQIINTGGGAEKREPTYIVDGM